MTMTTIKHHLNEQLMIAYAAGNLPEAFNLVVATHISMCDDCRAALAAYEAIGGEIVDDCDCEALSQGAFAQCMSRIAAAPVAVETAPRQPARTDIPAPLLTYMPGGLESVAWRKIGGGVSQMILPTAQGATVRLLKIPGGTAVPDHGHRGMELTMVLKGAFADESDRFAEGDIEIANQDLTHTPVAEAGSDCICLAATDAPLRFSAFLPRVAQRFLKI